MKKQETTINLERLEICDLMMACTVINSHFDNDRNTKWAKLHRKLKEQLDTLDKVQEAQLKLVNL